MRVVVLNQHYAPNRSATAQLLTDLCEDLCEFGDQVTVCSAPLMQVKSVSAPAPSGAVVVRRVGIRPTAGKKTGRRLLTDISYLASSSMHLGLEKAPDVVVALSSPPMLGAAAGLVASLRGVPCVQWVHDIYPDIAIEAGVVASGGVMGRSLRHLSRWGYERSERLIALSEGMKKRLMAAGVPAEKVRVQANWADGRAIRPIDAETSPFRRKHGLEGRFVAMYSGNLGVVHDVRTMVEAARMLVDLCPRFMLVFVGGGARLAEARRLARGLDNVRFIDAQPREQLSASLGAADVHLVTLQASFASLVVPSKFYGAMAAARPVLFIGPAQSEVDRVVTAERVGWTARLGEARRVAHLLCEAESDADERKRRGDKAREVMMKCYERSLATRQLRTLLCEVAECR